MISSTLFVFFVVALVQGHLNKTQISRKHKHGNFTITSRAAPIDFNNYYEIGHKGITGIGGKANSQGSLNGSLDMSTLPLQLQVQERTTDDVKQLFSQSEYAYLLALIPEDKDDSNYKKRSLILNFLNQNNLYELLGQEFKISESHNKGLVLQTLFKHALTLNKVTSNESLSEALNFYMDKINMNGRGGHPLVWVKHNTKTIDLNSLLNVVDVSKLNKNELVNFDKVYEFFMNKLNMDEQLKGFDFNKHRSQEQLLKDVATHLLKQDNVEDKIRKYIEELILHLPVPRVNVEDN